MGIYDRNNGPALLTREGENGVAVPSVPPGIHNDQPSRRDEHHGVAIWAAPRQRLPRQQKYIVGNLADRWRDRHGLRRIPKGLKVQCESKPQ